MKLALLILLVPCAAGAASFDCAKAATRTEKAICADAELSALDEHLGRFYFAARDRLAENASCIVADQQQWLRAQRNPCADAACAAAHPRARRTAARARIMALTLPPVYCFMPEAKQ